MRVGTTPLSIQVVETIAMHRSIGTAGRICRALRRNPMIAPRRLMLPPNIASTTANIAETRRAIWLYEEIADAPANTITHPRNVRSDATGSIESASDGSRSGLLWRCNCFNPYVFVPWF